jgi:hypothetical protein
VLYRKTTISQLGEGQFVGQLDLHADKFDVALALERSVSFEVWRILGKTLTKLSRPENPTSEG